MRKLRKNPIYCYIAITFGVITCVLGLNFFLLPGKIAAGGFTGVATILYYLLGLPVGATVLILNIPFYIMSYRKLGRQFVVRSCYAIILYSVLADLIPIYMVSDNTFLSAIYGGLLMGIGLGVTIYFGGSTGGSDIAAMLLHDRFRFLSVGAVVFASGVVFDMQAALFAIVSLYLSTKMIELLTEGLSKAKAFIIISKEYEEIERRIMQELERGVTEFYVRGGFTKRDAIAILCMVERGSETLFIKNIVTELDPGAFMILLEAKEVSGEGFSYDKITHTDENVSK